MPLVVNRDYRNSRVAKRRAIEPDRLAALLRVFPARGGARRCFLENCSR